MQKIYLIHLEAAKMYMYHQKNIIQYIIKQIDMHIIKTFNTQQNRKLSCGRNFGNTFIKGLLMNNL